MLRIKYIITSILLNICEMTENIGIGEKIGFGLMGLGMLLGGLGLIG